MRTCIVGRVWNGRVGQVRSSIVGRVWTSELEGYGLAELAEYASHCSFNFASPELAMCVLAELAKYEMSEFSGCGLAEKQIFWKQNILICGAFMVHNI